MCEHPQTHAEFRPPAEPCRSDARKSSKRSSENERKTPRRFVTDTSCVDDLLPRPRPDCPPRGRTGRRAPEASVPVGSGSTSSGARRLADADGQTAASQQARKRTARPRGHQAARARYAVCSLFSIEFLDRPAALFFQRSRSTPAGCRHLWVRCGSVRFRSRRSHCLSRLHVREELGRAGHVKAAFISYCQTLIQGGYSFFLIFSSMTKLHSESRVWCCHVVRALLFV
jgi:hypothetical protein